MKIVQILNNNVAVVHDRDERPAIVMGTGLAFGKKKGDVVEPKKIESTFKLRDEHAVDDLSTLLKDVPEDFVETSYSLIERSQQKYDFAVESYIYVTLTMHLYAAYQRLKQGRYKANYSLPDLSSKYPEAYQIADDFLEGFKESLQVELPSSERDSIALHFINAHGDQVSEAEPIDRLDDQLVVIVSEVLKNNGIIRNQENFDDFERLLTHVKYFAQRLRNEERKRKTPLSSMSLTSIGKDFPRANEIVDKIAERIKHELGVNISNLERLYMVIHIARLLEGS